MLDAVLIAGPTASGKSSAALALAQRLNGTVINADSMQVYRELSCLTARPSKIDLESTPHRLYGYVPAGEPFSVGRWAEDAQKAIEDSRREGRVPIVTGGSGLYFLTLLNGLSPVPDIPDDIRRYWRQRALASSSADLHQALAERDDVMAGKLQPSDTQRLVRALEVIDATGTSLAEWQEESGTPILGGEALHKIVVAPPREALYAAIDGRFETMLQEGAIEEVRALSALNLDPGLPLMRALGVRELMAHLAGQMTLEDAAEKTKLESRRYAKRQMTWARRFMADWNWFGNGAEAAASLPG